MKFNNTITVERVREVFTYDESTGKLYWRIAPRRQAPKPQPVEAGYIRGGYRVVAVDGIKYGAHRLVWLYAYGEWPANTIDHIDGDPTNNRLCNLRDATIRENSLNKRATRGYAVNRNGKFRAYVYHNRNQIYLGAFDFEEEARAARVSAANSAYGEFSPHRTETSGAA